MADTDFNYLEFEVIEREAGRNAFVLTPKRWIESVGAIGMVSKQGRYASTFAHKDIAFKFAAWISAPSVYTHPLPCQRHVKYYSS